MEALPVASEFGPRGAEDGDAHRAYQRAGDVAELRRQRLLAVALEALAHRVRGDVRREVADEDLQGRFEGRGVGGGGGGGGGAILGIAESGRRAAPTAAAAERLHRRGGWGGERGGIPGDVAVVLRLPGGGSRSAPPGLRRRRERGRVRGAGVVVADVPAPAAPELGVRPRRALHPLVPPETHRAVARGRGRGRGRGRDDGRDTRARTDLHERDGDARTEVRFAICRGRREK